jgi:hypothetical protein
MGRPQQVIFDQLPVRNWDVFVGILWTRFGIPSLGSNVITGNDANSGTEEEFAAALNCFRQSGKPRILFYRRTGGPADILRLDTQQLALVQDFFKKFDAGQPFEGLYRKYEGPDQFRSLLRAHFQEILISGTLAYPPQVCTSISITDDFITPAILEGARARRNTGVQNKFLKSWWVTSASG